MVTEVTNDLGKTIGLYVVFNRDRCDARFFSRGSRRIRRGGAGHPKGARLPKCKLSYLTREKRRNNTRLSSTRETRLFPDCWSSREVPRYQCSFHRYRSTELSEH